MRKSSSFSNLEIVLLSFVSGIVYFFSNPNSWYFYNYTFLVAENFLHGQIGFEYPPPSWLNEFVEFEGFYYSVFPLGSVVTMLPLALLKVTGLIGEMPSALIVAFLGGSGCLFLLLIGRCCEITFSRLVLTAFGILFGTWMWTNLTFGGAWQLALGFAVVGELGAIYFTAYNRKPFVAGLFFALAFGNRTEILLTAPIFLFLLSRSEGGHNGIASYEPSPFSVPPSLQIIPDTFVFPEKKATANHSKKIRIKSQFKSLAAFCMIPFILGVLTLIYNHVRFQSFTDFGYARIPGVLNEPWYDRGIFSVYYIPRQAWEMLLKPWEIIDAFPYLIPDGFSSSILLSSPFILYAFRSGWLDSALKRTSWLAILALTVLLWMHGNSGGWQFGYRYWMVCLPWLFIILLETSPKRITRFEWAVFIFSILANAYATWLFHWTEYLMWPPVIDIHRP